MSAIVDKRVHIADFRARRLEQLAAAGDLSEDALIEKALDMLFRERDWLAAGEQAIQEGKELLQKLEAELGPIPAPTSTPLPTKGATIVVGTLINPERIRRIEERR